MKRILWVSALLLLLAAGWLARGQLLPSETARINRALRQLAQDASFGPDEGNIAAVQRAARVADRFAPNATIEVDLLGVGSFRIDGPAEIRARIMAARQWAKRLDLRFLDPVIRLGDDDTTAEVHLTATADLEGLPRNTGGFEALEFSLQLRKVDGRWLIERIVTIPTLKQ